MQRGWFICRFLLSLTLTTYSSSVVLSSFDTPLCDDTLLLFVFFNIYTPPKPTGKLKITLWKATSSWTPSFLRGNVFFVRVDNVIYGFIFLRFSNEQCIHTSGLRVFWTRISEKLPIFRVKCDECIFPSKLTYVDQVFFINTWYSTSTCNLHWRFSFEVSCMNIFCLK